MDIVITYVNGKDPLWQKQYRKTTNAPLSVERFRDWGTLKYLLRGIEKNMPYIKNVFLVVAQESQVPDWINRDKVKIVLHKDIIPAKFLPTFNSCVIEMFLHHIKGLSDKFIYFNDDCFPVLPCPEDMFFDGDKPKCYFYGLKLNPKELFTYHVKNSSDLAKKIAKYTGPDKRNIRPQHIAMPMLRKKCEFVFNAGKKEILNSLTVLRSRKGLNQYLYNDYLYFTGGYTNAKLPYTYINFIKYKIQDVCDMIKKPATPLICINDAGSKPKQYEEFRENILETFENAFPEKSMYEKNIPEGLSDKHYFDGGSITVSLTTYGKRINYVADSIKSIMRNTLKPNRIVLWLAEDEFKNETIPESLKTLIPKGLTIKYCEDIKSYKKIIPSLKEYPNDVIITIDDDIIYNSDFLAGLIEEFQKYSDNYKDSPIIAYRCNKLIVKGKTVELGPHAVKGDTKNIYMQTGGGVLIPPHSFTNEVFNKNVFWDICQTGDEIWLTSMAILNHKTILSLGEFQKFRFSETCLKNTPALSAQNCGVNGKNKIMMRNVFSHYNLFDMISPKKFVQKANFHPLA